jgi:hypothetical protein
MAALLAEQFVVVGPTNSMKPLLQRCARVYVSP